MQEHDNFPLYIAMTFVLGIVLLFVSQSEYLWAIIAFWLGSEFIDTFRYNEPDAGVDYEEDFYEPEPNAREDYPGLLYTDESYIDIFTEAMKTKMGKASLAGRSGWDDGDTCSPSLLRHLMQQHIEKGDPVDVANFCMMLYSRGASTSEKITCQAGHAELHEGVM